MSANLVVDLSTTVVAEPSIVTNSGGGPFPCSGAVVGNAVDLLLANTYCNVFIANGVAASGQLRLAVQTSDTNTSGNFVDPTSGLAAMPSFFQSGGLLWVNSGGANSYSGDVIFAPFLRLGRYARLIALSGDFFNGPFNAGFISQLKTVGSGGGFTFSPGSGTVTV